MASAESPRDEAHVPVDTDKVVGGSSNPLAQMCGPIRGKHSTIRTEQICLDWADS